MTNNNNYKFFIDFLESKNLSEDIILYILHITLYGLNYSRLLKNNKIEWKNRKHNLT